MATTSPSATLSASAAASSTASPQITVSSNLKIVGIVLAVASGILIGSSFVFKKKGLLRSQKGHTAGEGVAYLKSPLWWLGMTMMIIGELCNFAAYAFIEALVVTPLGALSVVICAILSSIFLKEKLSFFGWLGCGLCILGSTIIALNGPREQSIGQIKAFQKLFLAPGFLVFGGCIIVGSLVIIFYFAPKYGTKSMLWYIAVCSMIGGLSVSVTTGLGAAIVTTVMGDNQFKNWFIYFLIGFIATTLITEVYYLNVALALFNTAMVTPTYYVAFSFCSMVTTVVLFQGLHASASQILTIVMAFLVICVGITILQMSKVDPATLSKLDRRSTMLLQAARQHTELVDEKNIAAAEDPGMDTLRGSFGAIGSIIRARSARRLSQSSRPDSLRARTARPFDPESVEGLPQSGTPDSAQSYGGLRRHQLYDAPMPGSRSALVSAQSQSNTSLATEATHRRPTITFDRQDVVHSYHPPGTGDNTATHEHRLPKVSSVGIPPVQQPAAYPPSRSRSHSVPAPTSPDSENDGGRAIIPRRAVPMPGPFSPSSEEEGMDPRGGPIVAKYSRPDARNVFPPSVASTTPLSSFPSASDSSSEGQPPWQAVGSEEDYVEVRPGGSTRGKTYPRGVDDREESVRLWQRGSLDESEESVPGGAGVRLVGSNPPRF